MASTWQSQGVSSYSLDLEPKLLTTIPCWLLQLIFHCSLPCSYALSHSHVTTHCIGSPIQHSLLWLFTYVSSLENVFPRPYRVNPMHYCSVFKFYFIHCFFCGAFLDSTFFLTPLRSTNSSLAMSNSSLCLSLEGSYPILYYILYIVFFQFTFALNHKLL